MAHIYNGILLSHKKERMPFAATQMDLKIIILSEVNRRERIAYNTTYMWNLKYDRTQLIYEIEITHRHKEQICSCQGTEEGGRMDWESGISRCRLFYMEWINNKALLYSTGNYIQYLIINHNRKEY